MEYCYGLRPLSPNVADLIPVGLVIAEQVGAVEHKDPGVFRIFLEGGGGPVGEGVVKGDLFA